MIPTLMAVIGHLYLWSLPWKRRIEITLAMIAMMPTGTPIHGPTPAPRPISGNPNGISR